MLSFLAEWFDPLPQLTKQYLLKYFCDTNEAEMVELKTKRLFLKRSPCPAHFTTKDFALGSKVGCFGGTGRLDDGCRCVKVETAGGASLLLVSFAQALLLYSASLHPCMCLSGAVCLAQHYCPAGFGCLEIVHNQISRAVTLSCRQTPIFRP